jgi:O-methyltransferase involved in polyketide biosynthesis
MFMKIWQSKDRDADISDDHGTSTSVSEHDLRPDDDPSPPVKLDTSVAHNARVWNYWLGGKDNFAPDRQVGDHVFRMFPNIVEVARADRAFLGRVVRYLVGEAGIRQFLDIGTGLPTAENTHEVAQRVARESRIVYVDNDPLVLVHARALLTSDPPGVTAYIQADLREPEKILKAAADTLDFTQPVAIMLLGVLNFVLDTDEARAVVRRLLDAVPSGSHLAITHPTLELSGEANIEAMRFWNENATPPITARTGEEVAGFLDGVELLEPGLVSCSLWRPDPLDVGLLSTVSHYGAVGRKP